jgi:putative DNA primase/helicase
VSWVQDALAQEVVPDAVPVKRGTIPLGRAAADFIASGAPTGEQRGTAVKVARNYWGAGYPVEDAAEALWQGFQASENDPLRPWTFDDAMTIARDVYLSPAPPPKPLIAQATTLIWDRAPKTQYPPAIHTFARTDTGNAELIAHLFGTDLRYDVLRQSWLVWAGHFWRCSDGEVARQYAKRAARWRFEAAAQLSADARESEIKWALTSEKRKGIDDALALSRGTPLLYDEGTNWNHKSMLLAVENGVIDLTAGQLRDGMRDDRITFHAPVVFDPAATCPAFLKFLNRVQPEPDLRRWLQRFAGYCLTGDVSEEVLIFNYGEGSNGKSTFWTCIQDLLGMDLAKQAAKGLLMAHKFERHSTEIAELHASRLVVSTEVDDGTVLAEGLVKWLTGGDRVNARFMHHDNFQFDPTFKIVLLANKRPLVTDDTVSTWRRIKVLPWTVTIPEIERDNSLKATLKGETSGILNWLLEGCLDWQRNGLGDNEDVVRATAAYRDSAVAGFVEDCCLERPDIEIPAGAFFNLYKTWCSNNGAEAALNATQFSEVMARRYTKKRSGRGVFYHGVGARPVLAMAAEDER